MNTTEVTVATRKTPGSLSRVPGSHLVGVETDTGECEKVNAEVILKDKTQLDPWGC